jgi:Fic family protein
MADTFNLETIKIDVTILNIISELDEFKGLWKSLTLVASERYSELKKIATIESIGSSTRIEGSKLTDAEIATLLSDVSVKSFISRDEQEVAGYAFIMNTIFNSWGEIALTENYIKQLHRDLLQYSIKDERHRGEYKKVDNNVVAFDKDDKKIGIIFQTASPFETPIRMQELISWTNANLKNPNLHKLIVIAIFVVVFLEIHPFQDGNGRLSRALTSLLLLKSGYTYVPYSSLENVIEHNKKSYYLALQSCQKTIRSKKPNWSSWIVFFLNSLVQQKRMLEKKIALQDNTLDSLSELSLNIVKMAKLKGRVTTEEIINGLNAKRGTVKDHLRSLVQNGYLIRHGRGKGTWYSST